MSAADQPARAGVDAASSRRERLRTRWQVASGVSGWVVPSDWFVPEVDDVVDAVLAETGLMEALTRLGAARARFGMDLTGTLRDVCALHTVAHHRSGARCPAAGNGQTPGEWLSAIAVGWGDATAEEVGQLRVQDSLTGLSTPAYLRTRLGEVYQECEAMGQPISETYALIVVSVDFGPAPTVAQRLAQLGGMVLVAETLRLVFSAGESRTLINPSTAVVLSPRHPTLAVRTALARRLIQERAEVDEQLGAPTVRVWLERLPTTSDGANALLSELKHSV